MSDQLPLTTDVPVGIVTGTAALLTANFDQVNANAQTVEDRLEAAITDLFGSGVLYGSYTAPLLAAGSGLVVDVAEHISVNGLVYATADDTITLPDNTTSYIFEYKDASLDSNTSGTVPTDANGDPAILLGIAVTASGAVSSVAHDTATEVNAPKKGERELLYGPGLSAPFDVAPYDITWDSTDGSDGTEDTLTIPFLLAPGAPVNIYNDRARMVNGVDVTISPSGSNTDVVFASGARPITDNIVTVIVTPA